MTVLDQLKEASYRGVEFFYQSSTESGGFKVAEHLYPGSNNFRVEQLGRVPRRFAIDARVTINTRDAFDNALNTSGPGRLSHPMFGNFAVKVTTFTKDDSIDDLGFYRYSIEFVVELGLLVPTIGGITQSVINDLKSTAWEKVIDFVDDNIILSRIETVTGT